MALRAALLGVEHPHSLAHLRTLQTLGEVDEIVLWDESETALANVRQTQGAKVVSATTNLDQALDDPKLQFVIAAVRNDLSPDVCIRALTAGKHVMSEKPMGRTAADVERVVQTATRAGLVLSICYQNRFHPCAANARQLVAEGKLGTLISLEARLLTTQVRVRNPKGWLFSHAKAGGGILSWLGCHYVDMMRYVSGDEVVAVSAEANTMSGEAIDVEDVISLSLRYRSGAIGSAHFGYMMALSGGGYHGSGYETYIGFRGREGRIFWDPSGRPPQMFAETTRPEWGSAPVRRFHYELSESPAYGGGYGEAFMRTFVRATLGECAPPTNAQDALWTARIMDAAYESARTGRRVEVAPVV